MAPPKIHILNEGATHQFPVVITIYSYKEDTEVEDRMISMREAVRILGVSAQTIRSWCSSGKMKHSRTPGGHRMFKLSDVEMMMGGESDAKKTV